MSWVLYPEGKSVCDLINQYKGIKETVDKLISNICPGFLLGLLDSGKMYPQRQGCYSTLF